MSQLGGFHSQHGSEGASHRRLSNFKHAIELEGSRHQASSQRLRVQCPQASAGLGYVAQVPAHGRMDGCDSKGDGVALHSRLDTGHQNNAHSKPKVTLCARACPTDLRQL